MTRFTVSFIALAAFIALAPASVRAERRTVVVRSGDPALVYMDESGNQRDGGNACTHVVYPFDPNDWTGATWVTEDAYAIFPFPGAWATIEGASWINWYPSPYSPGMGYVQDHFFTYESTFELPEAFDNASLYMRFTADDWMDVYLNGQKIVDWSSIAFGRVPPPDGFCTFGCISDVTVTDRALLLPGTNTLRFEQYEPDWAGGLVYDAAISYDAVAPVQDGATGNTYARFDTTRGWADAKAFCESRGAHLATVTSPGENDLVYGLCSGATPQWCWVGATDEAVEGTWQWVDGERWGTYANWAGGEPNNCSGLEHYLMYFTSSDDLGRAGTWNDLGTLGRGGQGCGGADETYRMSAICEWDRVPVDVKPGGCPNPLKQGTTGSIAVAIAGTASIDPAAIDPATVRVAGVAPSRASVADVATPYAPWFGKTTGTACTAAAADGFPDLVLQVDAAKLLAALGTVTPGEVRVVKVTGRLLPAFGATPFEGEDVVTIQKK